MAYKSAALVGLFLASSTQATQIGRPSKVQQDDGFVFSELVQGEKPAPAAALMALRGAVPDDQLLPIGEGAYQSGEAVMQRTKDERMACEKSEIYFQAHWAECYKYQGDFVDGPTHGFKKIAAGAIGNKHAIGGESSDVSSSDSSSDASKSTAGAGEGDKSGAAAKSVVCTTALAVAAMLRHI
eukprot:TRINITY_DN641_c0_g2_i1.p1 TRINITY_DN641_c0_g2~~TRINITY_DN641_c0_g2_i1.p1  ORF type:complete len:183 (-),score=59.83 TRINITY_DN641_c0_g2_i1:71-619(-)